MVPTDESKPIGMNCPNCGWGWATTYIDPILEDDKEYSLIILEGNKTEKNVLKAIAKIAECNFIKAKEIIADAPFVIKKGRASEIKNDKAMLEENEIAYSIGPEFIY